MEDALYPDWEENMKHERDPNSVQHETLFVCLNCRKRIEGFIFWEEDELVCPGPWSGRWHWVRTKPKVALPDWGLAEDNTWFPALREQSAAGGWTDRNTWEAWDCAVVEWKLIPLPEELP